MPSNSQLASEWSKHALINELSELSRKIKTGFTWARESHNAVHRDTLPPAITRLDAELRSMIREFLVLDWLVYWYKRFLENPGDAVELDDIVLMSVPGVGGAFAKKTLRLVDYMYVDLVDWAQELNKSIVGLREPFHNTLMLGFGDKVNPLAEDSGQIIFGEANQAMQTLVRIVDGLCAYVKKECTPINGRSSLYDAYSPIVKPVSEPVTKRIKFVGSPRSIASSVTIDGLESPVSVQGGEEKVKGEQPSKLFGDKRQVGSAFSKKVVVNNNIMYEFEKTKAYKAFMRASIKNNIEFARFFDENDDSDSFNIKPGVTFGRANYALLGRAKFDCIFDKLNELYEAKTDDAVANWFNQNADISQHQIKVNLYSASGKQRLQVCRQFGKQRNRDYVHGKLRIPVRRDWMPNWFNPKEPKTLVLWRDMIAELRQLINAQRRNSANDRRLA